MSGTRKNPPSGGGKRAAARSTAPGAKPSGAGKGGGKGSGKKGWRDWRTALRRLLIGGIAGVVVLCAIFVLAYMNTTIPDPNAAYQAQTTYVYYSNGDAKVGSFATQNRDSVPLGEIAKPMQDAAVAAEDHSFWTNKGIDPKGILRAAFSDAKGGATQGGSTITQQYVKLLYLTQQRTLSRKVKEVFLSLKLQRQESKQEILNGYLNTVYFGHGAYGVQAAAETYFGVTAKELKPAQAAMLAAIINSPNYYDPYGSTAERQGLLNRYQYVVNWMVKMQTLDPAVGSRISGHLPKVVKQRASNAYGGQRGFMMTMVKKQLLALGFSEQQIDGGGLRVTTTFNRGVMAADQSAYQTMAPKGVNKLHVGIASVNVKTGALMGIWGGQSYLKSQLNYATLASTSVGSSFKPFALAAGLEQGFSLKSTFDGDSPYHFPGGGRPVQNEGEASGQANGHSYGPHINLIYALQQSVNTAFIDLTMSMNDGPYAIKKTAIAMGIPESDKIEPNSGIALGQTAVAPVDMANAYATIANRGKAHPWYVISKVTDSDGKVLWQHHADEKRAIPEGVADDVSYAMQQVVKGGTGTAALSLGRSSGGKTGTATNNAGDVISSWFVGFTPQVSTAVMYLRGNGYESLEGYLVPFYGATYPARTWTAAMKGIMSGYPVEEFPPAANVKGVPPSSGHTYTPPPPKPTRKAKPTQKATPTKKATPSNRPTPTNGPTNPAPPSGPPEPSSSCTTVGPNVTTGDC